MFCGLQLYHGFLSVAEAVTVIRDRAGIVHVMEFL